MTPVRVALRLDALDDRTLPAVSFTDAGIAAGFVELAKGPIQDLTSRLGQTEPKRQAAVIARAFPDIAARAFAAEQTLTAFLADVQATIVAHPGNDDLLAVAYRTWDAIVLARQEVPWANALGVLYGGVPFVPGPGPTPIDPDPDADPNLRTTIPDLNAPGWVTQPSGLRTRDRIVGSGVPVIEGATVTVEYRGWLTNGTEFDSSDAHGGPQQFSLDEVIEGWMEGVPGMQPGGIRQLFVPSALGYGPGGSGSIPPNADLVFEIKMISSP